MKMTPLDDLPDVKTFLGIVDLQTGSLIIAALGIVHPMAYGCSLFMPISYLIVTIWILVTMFFAASIVLFFGITKEDHVLCAIWVWYALIFVVVMMMLMILLLLVFISRKQKGLVFITILGMLWYIVTIYFILVVNSYRKNLIKVNDISEKVLEKNKLGEDIMEEFSSRKFLRFAERSANLSHINFGEDLSIDNGENVSCINVGENVSKESGENISCISVAEDFSTVPSI